MAFARVLAVVLAWHGAHALSTHLDRAALSRRRWIGAAGGLSLARAPPCAARAAATVDASAIEETPGGVKFVVTKKGACPGTDALGVLGSCKPGLGSYVVIDYTGFLPSGEVIFFVNFGLFFHRLHGVPAERRGARARDGDDRAYTCCPRSASFRLRNTPPPLFRARARCSTRPRRRTRAASS